VLPKITPYYLWVQFTLIHNKEYEYIIPETSELEIFPLSAYYYFFEHKNLLTKTGPRYYSGVFFFLHRQGCRERVIILKRRVSLKLLTQDEQRKKSSSLRADLIYLSGRLVSP